MHDCQDPGGYKLNAILLISSRGYCLVEEIRHSHKHRHGMGFTGGWVWCPKAVMPMAAAHQSSLRNDEEKVRVSQIPCQCAPRENLLSAQIPIKKLLLCTIQGYGVGTSHLYRKTKYGKGKSRVILQNIRANEKNKDNRFSVNSIKGSDRRKKQFHADEESKQ